MALMRMRERGATASQVKQTVLKGRVSAAKFARTRFRHVLDFNRKWNGIFYAKRQIDSFAVRIDGGWLVITVIIKYF